MQQFFYLFFFFFHAVILDEISAVDRALLEAHWPLTRLLRHRYQGPNAADAVADNHRGPGRSPSTASSLRAVIVAGVASLPRTETKKTRRCGHDGVNTANATGRRLSYAPPRYPPPVCHCHYRRTTMITINGITITVAVTGTLPFMRLPCITYFYSSHTPQPWPLLRAVYSIAVLPLHSPSLRCGHHPSIIPATDKPTQLMDV